LTITLFLVVRYYSNKVGKTSFLLQDIEGKNRNFLLENKKNQEIIRVFNAFETRNIIFKRLFNDKSEKKIENAINNGKSSCFSNLLINFSTVLVVFIGFYLTTIDLIDMGSLVGIYAVIGESILYPLLRIPDKIIENSKRKACLIRINTFMNLPYETSINVERVLNNMVNEDGHFLKLIGNNINFSYDKTNAVLRDCNFQLSTGEIVSLVGESGGGKTTLLSIILSLRNSDSGEVYLYANGKNEKEIGNSLRDYFSYVPQENALFPGLTLKENLGLGNPNLSILEMEKICKELSLHDKIETLELQYDTIIDANIPFSIGQLQRLSIARAILSHKPFIILDEPFSALDERNISILQNILTKLSKTTGILIVSHQEASIEISGRIYNMNGGGLHEKQQLSFEGL
jgi:ABC-type multidrug transport system fused ATPase/permease subunit